jgi:hypothetical protein
MEMLVKYYLDQENHCYVCALFEPMVLDATGHALLWVSRVGFAGLPMRSGGVLETLHDQELYQEISEDQMRALCPRLVEHINLPSLERICTWVQSLPPDMPIGFASSKENNPLTVACSALACGDLRDGRWRIDRETIVLVLPDPPGRELSLQYNTPEAFGAPLDLLNNEYAQAGYEQQVLAREFSQQIQSLLGNR